MITPPNGRGLQPKVRASTAHLWTMDAVASPDLVVGGTVLTDPGGAASPLLGLGRLGNATLYNGVINYLHGPTGESASFHAPFTVEVWMLPDFDQAGNCAVVNYSEVGALGVSLARNTQFELQYNVDRTLTWRWERTALGTVVEQTSTAKLPMYQWSHVAIVRGPTTGGSCPVYLYINGELAHLWPTQAEQEGGTAAAVKWYVGRQNVGAYFSGYINSIAMHEEELSAADIRESFRRGFQWEPGNFDTRIKVVANQYTVVGAGAITPEAIELTDFRGQDWVQSVEVSDNIDATCSTAKLNIFRNVFNNSLAPEMDASPLNLFDDNVPSPGYLERPNPGAPGPDDLTVSAALDNWRLVEIFAARVPMGATPASYEWQSIFKGRIDKFDWASDVIQVTLRDQAGVLEDMTIENEGISYAAPAPGTALVTAVNAMIAAEWKALNPAAAPVLVAPYPPATMLIDPWEVQFQSFMDQVLPLSDMIGWSLKYKWNPFTLAWEWTLFDPHRLRESVDGVFEPEDVLQYQTMQQDITSVRNVVRIGYEDDNGAIRAKTRFEHDLPPYSQTSMQQYGRRFISISEKTTTQINNDAEATAMADAILYDLLIPYADKAVTMKCFFEIEVGDRYSFLANGVHYDSTFTGSVVSVSHRFSQDQKATTVVQLRGRPASAWKRHIDKGGGPMYGVRPPPGSLENVTTGISDQVKKIPFQSFIDLGLPASVTNDESVITPNPSFSIHPDYDNGIFPGWAVDTGNTWGAAGSIFWNLTDSETGDACLTLLAAGASATTMILQPITNSRCVSVNVRWKGTAAGDTLVATVNFYDRNRAALGSSTAIIAVPAVLNTFQTDIGHVAPSAHGAGAVFATLTLAQAGAVPGVITIDRVRMAPTPPHSMAFLAANQTAIAATTQTIIQFSDASAPAYDYCGDYNNATFTYTVPERGRYQFNGQVTLQGYSISGPVPITDGTVAMFVNGAYYMTVAELVRAGSLSTLMVLNFRTPAIEFADGTTILFKAVSQNTDFDIMMWAGTWFEGYLVEDR